MSTASTPTRTAPAGTSTSGADRSTAPSLKASRPLLTYLLLDLRRTLLNPANLFFVIAFPLGLFLIFGNMSGMSTQMIGTHGNASASIMLAMASYSACLGATSAATSAATELAEGWARQMAVTSRGLRGYAVVKLGTALLTALVPVIVVFAAGALTSAQLDAQTWVLGFLACLVGAVPFVLWGLAAGLWLPTQASVAIATSLVALFGFLGNAFMPLTATLVEVGRFTPMYGPASLARWPLTEGYVYVTDNPAGLSDSLWVPVANLVVWTVLFGLAILAARRRVTARR